MAEQGELDVVVRLGVVEVAVQLVEGRLDGKDRPGGNGRGAQCPPRVEQHERVDEQPPGRPRCRGVLASPVFDPAYSALVRVLWRWRLYLTREPPSLERVEPPEGKRAGLRRLLHVLRAHRRHSLTDAVGALGVPVLVIRGRDGALGTPAWTRRLPGQVVEGGCTEVFGPRTFCWRYSGAWSPPIRASADRPHTTPATQ